MDISLDYINILLNYSDLSFIDYNYNYNYNYSDLSLIDYNYSDLSFINYNYSDLSFINYNYSDLSNLVINLLSVLNIENSNNNYEYNCDNDISNLKQFIYNDISYSNLNDKVCPIELDNFKNGDLIYKTNCNHYFKDGILKWLKKSNLCPICKEKITNNKYIPKLIGIGYFENIFL